MRASAHRFHRPRGRRPRPGAPVPRAARPGVDYSPTNVQESGVDEPDLVKTDGDAPLRRRRGEAQAIAVGRALATWASLPLRAGERARAAPARQPRDRPVARRQRVPAAGQEPRLRAVPDQDHPDRGRRPRSELDARPLAAGARGRLASAALSAERSARARLAASPASSASSRRVRARPRRRPSRATARSVSRSRLANWLPTRSGRTCARRPARGGPLVRCGSVRRPPSFAGVGMLTVITADLEHGMHVVDSDAVLADGQIVYSSPPACTSRLSAGRTSPENAASRHRCTSSTSRSPGRTEYRASGAVPGFLVNQWALDEQDGLLRVASTEARLVDRAGGRESESFVTGPGGRRRQARLRRPRRRPRQGRADLRGPVHGRRRLRRHVPSGRSALHRRPLRSATSARRGRAEDPGLLVVPAPHRRRPRPRRRAGRDGKRPGARDAALAVRRFDLRPTGPAAHAQGSSSASEAEYDHHAFLYWPRTGLTVVPVNSYDRAATTRSPSAFGSPAVASPRSARSGTAGRTRSTRSGARSSSATASTPSRGGA